jgi:hypothetical protein
MTAGRGRESAKPHSRQRVLSTAGLNFHAGRIGVADFRNFDGADIGKEIGGEIARNLMGDGSQRVVVFPAFDRKTQTPRVERRAAFGANDDI